MIMGGRWFASDNNATTHPEIMEALKLANEGHALGYGDDPLSARVENKLATLFGAEAIVRLVLNGTGANVYALGCLCGHGDAVFCSEAAHIFGDETGAPIANLGVQLIPVRSCNGKILPDAFKEALSQYNSIHKPRPAVLSISQPTEMGTVYSQSELCDLYRIAKQHGLYIHVDGARLSNAAAFLGCSPAEASGYVLLNLCKTATEVFHHGADAVCFGGTKNGLMFGEAVIFAPAHGLKDISRLRKTRLQLASKMRYIAAQYEAYIYNDLWKKNALHANNMASLLAKGFKSRGFDTMYPVNSNAVFIKLPKNITEYLRVKSFFYDWEDGAVRIMASWDTSREDIEGFLKNLDIAIEKYGMPNAPDIIFDAKEIQERVQAGREFLKSNWQGVNEELSDMGKGLPMPAHTQAPLPGAIIIKLPEPNPSLLSKSFYDVTATRRSRRRYKGDAISLEELSCLLWACAGLKTIKNENAFRTVPSGGCRHPLDLILYVRRVDGLAPGLYRHLPLEQSLALLEKAAVTDNGTLDLDAKMDEALAGQLRNCALMFIWTAIPYRTEWRYSIAAAKTILLDAGHSCQALYSTCEALGLGTCAQANYRQVELDTALGLDGKEEFSVYTAPVGRV